MPIWLSRLLDLLLRRRREARLDEEIATHLAALQAEHEGRGLSPHDASLVARRVFGGVDQVKAHVRDARGCPWLAALWQDASFAVRHLARGRAFSLPLLAVLALGIGVGHLFFTLTYASTLRGLPIADVDRVLYISTIDAQGRDRAVSYQDFLDLVGSQRTFAELAAYVISPMTAGDAGDVPDRFEGAYTTASGFAVSGARAILGRVLDAGDERPAQSVAVVLTARVWQDRFASDPAIVGRQLLVNAEPAVVVGVVSDRSGFPSPAALFLPLTARPGLAASGRGDRSLRVFGRLSPTSQLGDARADLESIAGTLAQTFPDTHAGIRLHAVPINVRLLPALAGWLPFITAGVIVLAVASTNAGNLMLASAVGRAREVAVRTSLGASRRRIVRQLLIESVLLAAVAAAAGLAMSRGCVALFRSRVPDGALPYWFDFSLDTTVFLALWLLTLATVVVFAVVPALQASRTAVVEVLKDGGHADMPRRRGRGTTLFLAAQLGLAVVLVAQVGVATFEADERLATDVLLDDRRVLTGTLTLSSAAHATADSRRAFHRRLLERLRAVGSVTGVALASAGPLEGWPERAIVLPDRLDATPPRVHVTDVSAGYFATLGTQPVRGREFTDQDGAGGDAVVIVNERLAALHFPGVDPVGRRLALQEPGDSGPPAWRSVVGVVPDIRQRPGTPAAVPVAYGPIVSTAPATAVLHVRGEGDGASLTTDVKRALLDVDTSVPFYRARSLPMAVRDATWVPCTSAQLATTVCLAAFALATFGLFAVVSHRVTLKRREIGLRMALGADRLRIVRLVIGSVAGALGAGLVLGLLGVVAWSRAFALPAANASASRPLSLAAAVVSLVATVVLGCLVPAWRAVRTPPAGVLRRE